MSLIHTFKDSEPENCAEWISQVKNGCAQSGRNLRQELINKSETMVQTFIRNQGDKEVENTQNRRTHSSRGSNSGSSTTSGSSAQPTLVPIHLKTPLNVEPLPKRSPKRDRKEKTYAKESVQSKDGDPSKNEHKTKASPHRTERPDTDGQPSLNRSKEEANETLSNLGAAAPKTYGNPGRSKTERDQKTKTKELFSYEELTLGKGGARAKQFYAPTKSFNNNKEYTQTDTNKQRELHYVRPQKRRESTGRRGRDPSYTNSTNTKLNK